MEYDTLSEAARSLPMRKGHKASTNLLWRWCRRGVKARDGHRVFLEHNRVNWSAYTVALFRELQRAARKRRMLPKLRFLLYPGNLTADDQAAIQRDDRGAIWLG